MSEQVAASAAQSEAHIPLDRRLNPVVRVAPAKLNLTLAVVGRRADGYHDLHSVMVPLGLADRLSLAAGDRADTLHVAGFPTGAGPDDLVLRAIAETRRAVGAGWAGAGGPPPALAARLEKRIPVAAGLGGGSSDAAAALDGALEAWGADLGPDERLRVALRLGSDVPFFLAGGPACVEGRGERVTPLRWLLGRGRGRVAAAARAAAGPTTATAEPARAVAGPSPASAPSDSSPVPVGVLLVTPPVAASTPAVFAAYAAGARPAGRAAQASSVHLADELRAGLDRASLLDRAGILAVANDLLPAALNVVPGLAALRRSLGRLLGRPIGLSGSGPTLWVLYPSLAEAEAAAAHLTLAIDDRSLAVPGSGEAFVAATTILGGKL